MRTILTLIAAAGFMAFTACDSKKADEASASTTTEEAINATDIAETTASPIDTQGVLVDTLATDSIK
ncbi:hypothetical protein TH63_19270 [Rufibacter radiotolerans]|uniref:Uncharacterized protein n=1 Tax=Rufibacter radiotolerans TaxID=1379910 RepID=A0A0H4W9Z2_9BACT|nr:hypothetical protein [Rufibacter radiotolerans]AKQ47296.1 hypothetical protein TH63_19270 [Rufibacter radiotolerans]